MRAGSSASPGLAPFGHDLQHQVGADPRIDLSMLCIGDAEDPWHA
jgi:hypothetical protein